MSDQRGSEQNEEITSSIKQNDDKVSAVEPNHEEGKQVQNDELQAVSTKQDSQELEAQMGTPKTQENENDIKAIATGSSYIKPVEDPFIKGHTYLAKHNMLALFQIFTAQLVKERPDDPLEFIINHINQLKMKEQGKSHDDPKRS